MKVVCIDTLAPNSENITEGKVYEILSQHKLVGFFYVNIIGNNGREITLSKDRFRPLDEYRLEKIEELLK
jgi:hypothetical protein